MNALTSPRIPNSVPGRTPRPSNERRSVRVCAALASVLALVGLAACSGSKDTAVSTDASTDGSASAPVAEGETPAKASGDSGIKAASATPPNAFETIDGGSWKATYPDAPSDSGPFRGDCGPTFGPAVGLGTDALLGAQCTIYAAGEKRFMVMTPTIVGSDPEVWIQCQADAPGAFVPTARIRGSLNLNSGLNDATAGLAVVLGIEHDAKNTFYLFDQTAGEPCADSKILGSAPTGDNGIGGLSNQWVPGDSGPGWCVKADAGAWIATEVEQANCSA